MESIQYNYLYRCKTVLPGVSQEDILDEYLFNTIHMLVHMTRIQKCRSWINPLWAEFFVLKNDLMINIEKIDASGQRVILKQLVEAERYAAFPAQQLVTNEVMDFLKDDVCSFEISIKDVLNHQVENLNHWYGYGCCFNVSGGITLSKEYLSDELYSIDGLKMNEYHSLLLLEVFEFDNNGVRAGKLSETEFDLSKIHDFKECSELITNKLNDVLGDEKSKNSEFEVNIGFQSLERYYRYALEKDRIPHTGLSKLRFQIDKTYERENIGEGKSYFEVSLFDWIEECLLNTMEIYVYDSSDGIHFNSCLVFQVFDMSVGRFEKEYFKLKVFEFAKEAKGDVIFVLPTDQSERECLLQLISVGVFELKESVIELRNL